MTKLGNVPCNGCRQCCKNTPVALHPSEGDRVEQYLTQEKIDPKSGHTVTTLQQKPNGDCVYLNEHGCGAYEIRPVACRTFDCRLAYWSLEVLVKPRSPVASYNSEGCKGSA